MKVKEKVARPRGRFQNFSRRFLGGLAADPVSGLKTCSLFMSPESTCPVSGQWGVDLKSTPG